MKADMVTVKNVNGVWEVSLYFGKALIGQTRYTQKAFAVQCALDNASSEAIFDIESGK